MNIILPENLPDTEVLLYQTDELSIILNSDKYNQSGSVGLLMDISPHSDYSTIVPDEDVDCSVNNDRSIEKASKISDLPDEFYSKFTRVVEMLESAYDLERKNNENYGVCVHCTCGRASLGKDLKFIAHFTMK